MKEIYYKIKAFFKNLYDYRKILLTDKHYDYDCLLEVEKFKLQLMLEEFKTSFHIDHTSNIRWITICIKLIDIIQENDSALKYVSTPNLKLGLVKYININNASRFQFKDSLSLCKNEAQEAIIKDELRKHKALYLYNKIRYNYMCEWWD